MHHVTRSLAILVIAAAATGGCGGSSGGGQKPALRVTNTLIAPGTPNSAVASTATAYLGSPSATLVLDLAAARFVRLLPLSAAVATVDAIDATHTHLAVRGFYEAGLLSLSDGAYTRLVQGSSLRRSSIANGYLYVPDFNARVLQVAALDGSSVQSINPYPDGMRNAGPLNSDRSPSGSTVVFGDEFTQSIHVVDTATNTLRGTFVAGGAALDVFALDDDLAIALFDGTIAYVPLEDPTNVPELFRISLLDNGVAYALHRASQRLYVVRVDGGPYTQDPFSAEIGVLDLSTREEVGRRLPIDIPLDQFPQFSAAVSEDGETVILAVNDATVYLLAPTTPAAP